MTKHELHNQRLKIANENETQYVIGRTMNNLAIIYQIKGDYYQALELYNQNLKIVMETKDYQNMCILAEKISMIRSEQKRI